jgi:hypothetical protein
MEEYIIVSRRHAGREQRVVTADCNADQFRQERKSSFDGLNVPATPEHCHADQKSRHAGRG